jgi:hypothetical protein
MKATRDLIAGLMFSGIGLAALIIARNYPFGSTLNMGAGYFPTIVSALILFFGVILVIQELAKGNGPALGDIAWRPLLIISAAIIGFAVLIDTAGLIPAVAFLVVVSWLADTGRKWRQLPVQIAIGIVVPILIFRLGLNMPIKLWML